MVIRLVSSYPRANITVLDEPDKGENGEGSSLRVVKEKWKKKLTAVIDNINAPLGSVEVM